MLKRIYIYIEYTNIATITAWQKNENEAQQLCSVNRTMSLSKWFNNLLVKYLLWNNIKKYCFIVVFLFYSCLVITVITKIFFSFCKFNTKFYDTQKAPLFNRSKKYVLQIFLGSHCTAEFNKCFVSVKVTL